MTVEYGWPLGMPTCRHLEGGVHEVRTDLSRNRIARVLFYIDKFGRMVLCTDSSRRPGGLLPRT
jgi:phage-related protein